MFELIIAFVGGRVEREGFETRSAGEAGFGCAIDDGLAVNSKITGVSLWEEDSDGALTLLHRWTAPEYSPVLTLIDN